MKFRFCGDTDCPDWVLVEINTLSRLSSVKLKLLSQVVAQGIINPPIDIEKAEKLFADSKLDSDIELQASIGCISFILSVATKFNSDSNILHSELQQLGLPREHSTSIKRVLDDQIINLTQKLKSSSLTVTNLKEINIKADTQKKSAIVELLIEDNKFRGVMIANTVDKLLKDLRTVRKTMGELVDST